ADRTTALMAAAVVRKLAVFAVAAGVDPAELPDGPVDLSRFVHLKKARRKETRARYHRRRRHRVMKPDPSPTKKRNPRGAYCHCGPLCLPPCRPTATSYASSRPVLSGRPIQRQGRAGRPLVRYAVWTESFRCGPPRVNPSPAGQKVRVGYTAKRKKQ